jgi:diguanylate cyclase (GGDEF)-like protein/PAS domain S-box-containing protein
MDSYPSAEDIARNLDGAPLQVAVLDEAGVIRSISRAWHVEGLPARYFEIGASYPDFWAAAAGSNRVLASQAVRALEAVLAGAVGMATFECPAGAIGTAGTFRVVASRLAAPHPPGVVVVHLGDKWRDEMALALEASEINLELVLDAAPALIAYIDSEQRYSLANGAYQRWYGLRPKDIIGRRIRDIVGDAAYAKLQPNILTALRGQSVDFEGWMAYRYGAPKYVRVSYRPRRGRDGKVHGFFVMIHDLTDRQVAEEALAAEKELAELTLQSISDAVITTDAEGRIDNMNVAAELLTGWTKKDARHRPLERVFKVLDEDSLQPIVDPIQPCLRHGVPSWLDDAILVHREGREHLIAARMAAIRRPSGEIVGAVLTFQDVTKERNLARRVAHQATHDPLTGLPNRLLFKDRLEHAMRRARRQQTQLALMILDLDHFKNVNDTMGHIFGDRLLGKVAERLKETVRDSDSLARLGGDEFAIIQTDLRDQAGAAVLADKIIEAVMLPFTIDNQEVPSSTSIGIAFLEDDTVDVDQLVRNADMALYRAKADGRNRFQFFVREMDTETKHRLMIERELYQAVEEEQLTLRYQPQVGLPERRLTGAEGLLRWRHPERGLLPPDKFLRIAESTGLIRTIGIWVLNQACGQAAVWLASGLPVDVAINLSMVQIKQPALTLQIERILAEARLPATHLEVEISECLLADPRQQPDLRRTMHELAELGVRVTLDDFGAGHVPLAELKRLPVSRIKIDRSLIGAIGDGGDGDAVARAVIHLGQDLGKRVVAKGVDAQVQLDFLLREGCDEAQGFLLGMPQTAAEIAGLLRKAWRPGDPTAIPAPTKRARKQSG